MHHESWKEIREKIETLQAENDRLRTIEARAKVIDKMLNCWTLDEDTEISYDFEGICPKEWKCVNCPLKEFKDALKGGR